MAPPELAPYYPVPTTKIVAMEHPMIIKNIDKGLTTLGTGVRPAQIMTAEDHTGCIPIYLRPVDPACAPLLSHNTATNNILLKLTVPKKTGRKRKRGSNDPWIFDSRLVASKLTSEAAQAQHIATDHGIPVDPQLGTSLSVLEPKLEPGTEPHRVTPAPRDDPKAMSSMLLRGAPQWRHCSKDQSGTSAELRSKARLDKPKLLRRALQDNVDQYQIEAVGSIWKTHRYRGMVDFHYSTTHGPFMARIHNDILPANLDTLKQFQFSPDKGIPHPNLELLPPPTLSDKVIPTNWYYHQNSQIKLHTSATGEQKLVNYSSRYIHMVPYVDYDCVEVMQGPANLPPAEPMIQTILAEVTGLFDQRPIWSRRALLNHLNKDNPALYLLRSAIPYVAYQFRRGPWRDALVKYGVDPRKDASFRKYQTVFFKIVDERAIEGVDEEGNADGHWHDIRSEYTRRSMQERDVEHHLRTSHLFDGQSLSLDGKIWQVCDITGPPFLRKLLDTDNLRSECDVRDGWYWNGTMAKIRAIMRTLITAIQLGRTVEEGDFAKTLEFPDFVPGKAVPSAHMPTLRIPEEQLLAEGDRLALVQSEGGDRGDGTVDVKLDAGKSWRKRRLRELRRKELLGSKLGTLMKTKRGRILARKLKGQYSKRKEAGAIVDEPITPSADGSAQVGTSAGIGSYDTPMEDGDQAVDEDGMEDDDEGDQDDDEDDDDDDDMEGILSDVDRSDEDEEDDDEADEGDMRMIDPGLRGL